MAKCSFRCIQDEYGGKTEELVFAEIDDYDRCSSPWEQCNINYENSYEDNMHQKRDFKTYPYMHENSNVEKLENQYSIFCNKNAESCASEFSKYHYETENQSLGKRNRTLPRHFSDYYIERPGNDYYLGKTSPSCSKMYQKEWSENDDFEPSENQNSCFIKNSRGFDNGSVSKYHNGRYIFGGNNRCSPSNPDNHLTELTPQKRRYLRKTLSTNNFERNWEKNDDFEQSENQSSCFNKNSAEFDDESDSKYRNERLFFVRNNRCFASSPENPLTQVPQNKRRCLRKTPSLSTNNFEKKWEKNDDFEQSEIQNSCFSDNGREFDDDSNSKYYNERSFFVRNNRCFPSSPENHPIELPQNERRCLRKTPSISINNSDKNWEENYDFEQSRNQNSCFIKNSREFDYDSDSKYYNERGFFVRNNRRFPSSPGNHFIELPQNKRRCLRKTPSTSIHISEKKWEKNDDFEQSENQNSCFRKNSRQFDNDSDSKYYNKRDIFYGNNRCFANTPDNCVTELPQNRYVKETPSLSTNNFDKKWMKNDDFEQSRNKYSYVSKNSTEFIDDRDFKYYHENQTVSLADRNSCLHSHSDNYFTEPPGKKIDHLRNMPSPCVKNYEKKWETYDNFVQFGNECSFPSDKITVANENSDPIYNLEEHTKTWFESNRYLPNPSDNYFIETPKKKKCYLSKTASPCVQNSPLKWEKNEDFEQSRKWCSFSCDKISVASDNEGSIYNYVGTRPLNDRHSCSPSYLDYNSIETPKKKRHYIRKTPYSTGKKYKKKWERNGNSEQHETECNFSWDIIPVANGNEGSVYNYELGTRPLNESHSFLPSYIDTNSIETPKKKIRYIRKTLFSTENKCEEKRKNNGDDELSETQCNFSYDKITVANDNEGSLYNYKVETRSLEDRHNCSASHLDDNSIETPKMKRRYIRKTPYSTEKKCEKKWKISSDSEQSETQSSCDNKECDEANTKFLRERNSSFPSRFNDYIVETPNKKRPFSIKTPSLSSKVIRKKHKEIFFNNSDNNISYFSKCSFFKNPDFVNRLMFFNDKDLDDTFVTEKSKDVMLFSDCESYRSLIITGNQKADDDIIHLRDCKQIFCNEKASDGTFVTGKSRDSMLYIDYEAYVCSILMENETANDDFKCVCDCPEAYFNDKGSDDTFLTETSKDIMLFSDYELHACSIITENQNADNDIMHISDCSRVFFNETNSDDTFVTERSNDVLLCSDYESYACSIITENRYMDDDIMHVRDFPQTIFDEEDLDDTFITERGKDVMLSNGFMSDTFSVIKENHCSEDDVIDVSYSPLLFNNEKYLDDIFATEKGRECNA